MTVLVCGSYQDLPARAFFTAQVRVFVTALILIKIFRDLEKSLKW